MADEPKCGKCHRTLFPAHPLDLLDSNSQKHISRNHIPVVVDFWAPRCGPCKMMAPALEQAASQLQPTARLAKRSTDAEQEIAEQFQIQSIPTIELFTYGREVALK